MKELYSELSKLIDAGQPGVLCTIIQSQGSTPRSEGSKLLVFENGETLGTIGGGEVEHRVKTEALEALESGQPRLVEYKLNNPEEGDPGVCGGQLMVYIEPVLPRNNLVVIGGGHVGREVAHLGKWLGFRVSLCEDRPEFCNPESVPDAEDFFPEGLPEISSRTFAALTTRSVDIDMMYLPDLLMSEASYIGVIGSRRRWETTKKQLLDSGVLKEKIDKVRSPIGLALNAETPREIALSIMAEIIMVLNIGDSRPLSGDNKKGDVGMPSSW